MAISERIKSPEQLNDYIHVTSPGAWIILLSVLVFLAGFFVWILAGSLEVSVSSYICTEGTTSLAFIQPADASKLRKGTAVRISDSGLQGTVEHVADTLTPYAGIVELVGETNALAMGIHEGDKLIQVASSIENAPEKVSRAVYVIDTVKPVSFLLK